MEHMRLRFPNMDEFYREQPNQTRVHNDGECG
jgi:hypothetical protein